MLDGNGQNLYNFHYIFKPDKFDTLFTKDYPVTPATTPPQTISLLGKGKIKHKGDSTSDLNFAADGPINSPSVPSSNPAFTGRKLRSTVYGYILGRSSYTPGAPANSWQSNADTFTIKLYYFKHDPLDFAVIGNERSGNFYLQPMYFVGTGKYEEGYGPCFTVPFRGQDLTPITIPFVYRFNSGTFETNFFNVGLAYGKVFGRTKYFKESAINPRDFYFAVGGLIGLGPVQFAANDSAKTSESTIGILYGVHVTISMNNIQLLFAGGLESALQGKAMNTNDWLNQNKPWIGFGIGLSFFNILIPNGGAGASSSKSSAPGSGN